MSPHDEIRRDLAAYTLGALPAAERSRIDGHLEDCDACRDELARLAPIPGLLGRITEDEATMVGPPSIELEDEIVRAAARRSRRQVRRWRAAAGVAAAAAVALLIGFVAPWSQPPGTPFAGAPAVGVTEQVEIVAYVDPRDWGMFVTLEVEGLPERRGYAVYAIGDDGREVRVASWRAVDGPATVEGSCYMAVEDAVALHIVSGDEVLATIPLTEVESEALDG